MTELKPIQKGEDKNIGFYLKSTWYFEEFYEKAILIFLGILGLWKLLGFFV